MPIRSVSSLRNHPPPSEGIVPSNKRFLALLVGSVLFVAACAGEPPDVPLGADGLADDVLVLGRSVYGASCSNCHGADGQGGTGPELRNGHVAERYPDVEDEIAVVTNGSRGMPSFQVRLSEDEIEAVVRYTREVLSQP